jgi:hypothetical protein
VCWCNCKLSLNEGPQGTEYFSLATDLGKYRRWGRKTLSAVLRRRTKNCALIERPGVRAADISHRLCAGSSVDARKFRQERRHIGRLFKNQRSRAMAGDDAVLGGCGRHRVLLLASAAPSPSSLIVPCRACVPGAPPGALASPCLDMGPGLPVRRRSLVPQDLKRSASAADRIDRLPVPALCPSAQ